MPEILLGFAIALAIGLTGVGAGTMTTPLLILLLRVSPATAVGTALTFGWVVKVASVPFYVFRKQVNRRVLLLLLAGGLPGVIAGGVLLSKLQHGNYAAVLYAVLGSLIVGTSGYHLFRLFRPTRRNANHEHLKVLPWFALPIGAEVGFSSAGAGALGSLLLLSATTLNAAEVVGTDLCFGLGVSFAGSLIQLSSGNYDPTLLWKLIAGGLCGAFTGSFLAGKIPQRPLRFALLVFLLILGFQLATHVQPAHASTHALAQAGLVSSHKGR